MSESFTGMPFKFILRYWIEKHGIQNISILCKATNMNTLKIMVVTRVISQLYDEKLKSKIVHLYYTNNACLWVQW